MPLESATFVGELNSANPTPADPTNQGDDHLRLIKAALVASFGASFGVLNRFETITTSRVLGAKELDCVLLCNLAAVGTVTLPQGPTVANRTVTLVNNGLIPVYLATGVGVITGTSFVGDGTNSVQVPVGQYVTLISNGVNWVSEAWGFRNKAELAAYLETTTVRGNGYVFENKIIIDQDVTIAAGKNGFSAGPCEIADGVTVTISDGSTWSIT